MSGHLWESTRDPEGFFSTLPAIATVLLGVFTGEWLRSKNSPQKRLSGCWYLASPAWLWADLGNVVSHHQEIVDQFLCALQRRICLACVPVCQWATDVKQWRRGWTNPFLISA